MVYRAGVGPRGCPIGELTVDKLVQAFKVMSSVETLEKVSKLGDIMAKEDGVVQGMQSFHNNLPLGDMICEVSIFNGMKSNVARVYCPECGLKMCAEVSNLIHRQGSGRPKHSVVPYRTSKWGIVAPTNVLEGLNQGINVAMYETAGGLWDLFAKPIEGAAKHGVAG